jgi:hypothetical protein
MEENIQELLNQKDENVVQFNVINTTNQNQFLDLFNSADLIPVATSLGNNTYPIGNISIFSAGQYRQVYNTINNSIYLLDLSTQNINVFDITTQLVIVTIPLPTLNAFDLSFCSVNNSIYVTDFNTGSPIVIVDCSLNIVSGTITTNVLDEISFIQYNINNNTMYIGVGRSFTSINFIYFLDCSTNTLTSSTSLPLANIQVNFSNVTSSNFIYFTYGNIIRKIDCSTNLITGISISVSSFTTNNIIFNPNNNLLYGTLNGTTNLYVINTITDTFLFNLSTTSNVPNNSYCLQLNTASNQIFVGVLNNNYDIFNYFSNTYIQTNQISNVGFVVDLLLIQSTQNLFTTDTNTYLTQISTSLTNTPFYISGSTNYNAFVNNLNNEPIFIQMIRLLVQNQNQLNNELQLTTIDSNGNQIFMPNFPINQVSAYQQQGNIGEISVNNVVFDGRTYINNYQLNPYENISFEIYYIQLDLTTASITYPIFFKPKVQLKEYIKKELNL